MDITNGNLKSEDIGQLASMIWETTVAMTLEPDPGEASIASGRSTIGCVQITGAWNGAVMLACPEGVARQAAMAMFACGVAQVTTSEMQDAVAELTNMLAGNIKGLLPEGCFLSLPAVIEGTDYSARLPGSRVVQRVGLSSAGSRITITVLERARDQRVAA